MRRLRIRRPSGIALVLALFTTAILIILSVSFLALALGESRSSRSAGYEGAAVQAANFGIGFAINYMGRGGNIPNQPGQSVWIDLPNADGLGFYNTLRAGAAFTHNGYPVWVIQRANDANNADRTIGVGPSANNFMMIPLGKDLQFTVSIDFIPLVNKGIVSYQLLSTAQVWSVPQGAAPLARRVIEARVLEESAASYLHFLSNGRSNNVQGQAIGQVNTPQQQILATNIVIPPGYLENGAMRVDGQNTTGANASNLFAAASGNLTFGPGTNTTKPKFDNMLTINALSNGYMDPGVADQNSGFFKGGFSPGTAHLGVPDWQTAANTLRKAAANVSQNGDVNGLIQVPTSMMQKQGRITYQNANPDTQTASAVNDPFVDHFETKVINGQSYEVPVGPDYRARIPNVEITVNNDQITVNDVSTLDGSSLGTQTFKVSQLEKGVLYVEGGNTIIKGGTNVTGQLTIVATERPAVQGVTAGREVDGANIYNSTAFNAAYNTTAVDSEAIYAVAARQAQDYYQYVAELARTYQADKATRDAIYATVKTPPYTTADLQALVGKTYPTNPGNPNDPHNGQPALTANIPQGAAGRGFYGPPSDANSPMVEREGNIVFAGDFKYNSADRSTSVGFLAQNFLLLNDNTPQDGQLNLNGVLMSGERAVQLDWDNTGRQPVSSWQTITSPGYNGNFYLKGSIVGQYVDVEGDYDKRGYFNQSFEHDPQLQYQRPPYFPQWDFASLPGGFNYVITHYVDRGSLSTEGAAN